MMFSVIIPSYNRYQTLCRALDSVLAQSLPAQEIIVVDDASTQVEYTTLAETYPMVRIYRQTQNRGVSACRNQGIHLANAPWLAFLDDDDEWFANKLKIQAEQLAQYPSYKICHCDEQWIRNGQFVNPMHKHRKQGGWVLQANLPLCAISPSAVVIHQTIFQHIGYFDESLPACEDYDLWLRITAHYPVLYIDQQLLRKYGGHADQLSKKYWGMDRFRIKSLINLLATTSLTSQDEHAVRKTLQQKIAIYLQGAKKRQKCAEISYYQQLQDQYAS